MPDLTHTLQGSDLGFLRMVAGTWGIDLTAPDAYAALPILVNGICSRPLVMEMVEALPQEARAALQTLLQNEGKLPWALFSRKFGEVRVMGAGKRDRERPDLNPQSPTERLWYRALVGKAFFNLPPEPQEYAYIPDDLLDYMQPLNAMDVQPLGRPASPTECALTLPANDHILDHACTLLAALRLRLKPEEIERFGWEIPLPILHAMLENLELVDPNREPQPEATRSFLGVSRSEALARMARFWMESTRFNDLRHLPGLSFEGEWANDALQTRRAVLDMLSHLPQDTWWNLSAFINAVKEHQPDFQRPAGDYDSWFIRRTGSETFLRGFSSWDEVDGALLRFIITGPMHWLGMIDLAAPAPDAAPSAFRASPWSSALWLNQPPAGLPKEDGKLHIGADGRLRLPYTLPRAARYVLARLCEWESEKKDEYIYRITPASLERAAKQGLRTDHLITLLRRYSGAPVPPSLIQALDHWQRFGVQASATRSLLLRVGAAEMIEGLRKTRAARYLGEQLNPTTILVKPGGEEAVRAALVELGYLTEFKLDV